MNKKLDQNEIALIGDWIDQNGAVVADDTAKRIAYLTKDILKKIATSNGGWNILYIDLDDSRYWELFYPHGEMQGGGPPSLRNLSQQEAKQRYKIPRT